LPSTSTAPTKRKHVCIIGAGPAGLTAAYELQQHSDCEITLFEKTAAIGGISQTINYKGNRIDIGGHRFFSKSEWVMHWWFNILPIQSNEKNIVTSYQNKQSSIDTSHYVDPTAEDFFEVRPRKSRIFYRRRFFDYPVKFNLNTLLSFGLFKSFRIGMSLIYIRLFPMKNENNLEDFYINRFGKELYLTFFKDYTKKVWGTDCRNLSAEWGRQRIKDVSLRKMIRHQLRSMFSPAKQGIGNKEVEQSLTEYFLYPPKGPGQLWEKVVDQLDKSRINIQFNAEVLNFDVSNNLVRKVHYRDSNGIIQEQSFEAVFSTMPLKHVFRGFGNQVNKNIRHTAINLPYRDFLIVGLLLKKLKPESITEKLTDNWLYIQDKGVKVGRIQLFHNWSSCMIADPSLRWVGAEYFLNTNEPLWTRKDEGVVELAKRELAKIGLIDPADVVDSTVVRMPKAYPRYSGVYHQMPQVRKYIDSIRNFYPMGRNGMHKYNNQDHSMLSAKRSVDHFLHGNFDKELIWNTNTDQSYHEQGKMSKTDNANHD
tara:strand:- start:681 stop:2291 length:1611 start_codon:yes stop_codon:yes gene_type:complete